MIMFNNVKHKTGEDGNSIIITLSVELSEEDAQDYIELDEILSNHDYLSISELDEAFGDVMCDYGLSYCDSILATSDWSRLSGALEALKAIIEKAKLEGVL